MRVKDMKKKKVKKIIKIFAITATRYTKKILIPKYIPKGILARNSPKGKNVTKKTFKSSLNIQ